MYCIVFFCVVHFRLKAFGNGKINVYIYIYICIYIQGCLRTCQDGSDIGDEKVTHLQIVRDGPFDMLGKISYFYEKNLA